MFALMAWLVTPACLCRIFSLNPVEGYKPPTLAGHKDALAGVFFGGKRASQTALAIGTPGADLLTVSRDGALFTWSFNSSKKGLQHAAAARNAPSLPHQKTNGMEEDVGEKSEHRKRPRVEESDGMRDGPVSNGELQRQVRDTLADDLTDSSQGMSFADGQWQLEEKHFFNQRGARLSAVDYHPATCMMVAGFSSGVFDLYEVSLRHSSQRRALSYEHPSCDSKEQKPRLPHFCKHIRLSLAPHACRHNLQLAKP